MTHPRVLVERLRAHQGLYQQLLQLVEQESQALRRPGSPFSFCHRRKELLPGLTQTLAELKTDRQAWLALNSEARSQHPEVPALLQACQDLIMKVIVLDRENEQTLLRKGLVPASHLPAAQRQQPHYVTQLYTRNHVD